LFEAGLAGRWDEAFALYRWFLPLLRMDTVPKFVQLIKLVQEETGTCASRVRAPRMKLAGAEREVALAVIARARAKSARSDLRSTPFSLGGRDFSCQ
jgi:1-pyrroline-4-hydroxy-2-carboxylate deaminase